MERISSTAAIVAAMRTASRIDAEAYTVHGAVLAELEAAARRGAQVEVRLEARPFADPKGHLASENRRLAAELQAAGADAQLIAGVHAKFVGVDGTLYLDDQNFGANDLVLSDDDAAEIARIPTRKSDALAQEAALLLASHDAPIVESESFGCCNAVSSALDKLGRAGRHPRLLVSARDLSGNLRERAVLQRLAADGVEVRVCQNSEKLAFSDAGAWIGSANATSAYGPYDLRDWGVRTADPAIAQAVRERLEQRWNDASTPLRGAVAPSEREQSASVAIGDASNFVRCDT